MELYINDKLFKEALGAFIIASSEMEFAVASLCSILGEYQIIVLVETTLIETNLRDFLKIIEM